MGVGGQRHTPAAFAPEKTWYPLYRSLGGPQSRSGRVQKIPPPGFDLRTVQPIASCYIPTELSRSTCVNLESTKYKAVVVLT